MILFLFLLNQNAEGAGGQSLGEHSAAGGSATKEENLLHVKTRRQTGILNV